MHSPPPPTLEDVARLAQVSTATVSRCLNTPERVSSATQEKVRRAVEELGYSPNFGARVLASKRTHTYGAVIPTMANAIFARGIQSFQEALSAQGATLLVASSQYDARAEEEQIRAMVARGADGLLLVGQSRGDAIYSFLRQHHVPYVLAWCFDKSSSQNMVGFDNAAAYSELTRRALALGHRRFGIICAPREGNDRARERVHGAMQTLEAAGLDADAIPVLEAPYSIDAAGDAFEQLMALEARPTLVMCGNDVQAVGALKRARAMRLEVPAEVSITGFDDLEIASVVEPGITTVHVPHQQMGRHAAELLTCAQQSAAATLIKLDTTLVERGSLAAPGH